MAWVPVNRSVFTHRKTMKMADLLDIPEVYAVAHLTALWTWAMDNAPTGTIPAGTSARMIARAAEFPGNPQAFLEALLESQYLAPAGDGYELPNWMEYGGKLVVQQEKDAERKRLGRAKESQNASDGRPVDIRVTADVEKKRKEKKRIEENMLPTGAGAAREGHKPQGKVYPSEQGLPVLVQDFINSKGENAPHWERELRLELSLTEIHGEPSAYMTAILRRWEREGLPQRGAAPSGRIPRPNFPAKSTPAQRVADLAAATRRRLDDDLAKLSTGLEVMN